MKSSTLLWVAGGILALLLLTGGGIAVSEYVASEREKPYDATIKAAAAQYGVPWQLLAAQLQQESDFNPNAQSSAGAQGIAQFIPATAAMYGLTDPFDPIASIEAQAHYMSDLYNQFGSWQQALAAYNAGPERVENAVAQGGPDNFLSYLPNETQNYVPTIAGNSGLSLT